MYTTTIKLIFLFYLLFQITKASGQEPSESNIKSHVMYLSSDALGGRGTNSSGYLKATNYAKDKLESYGLDPIIGSSKDKGYLQVFDIENKYASKIKSSQDYESPTSRNVIGLVRGTEILEEYIVLSAHLDHLGIIDGQVHNGANDNATGSASIIELARLIAQKPLKRSVIFVLFGAEEIGFIGSKYFVDNSPIPLDQVVANLNIDGIGAYINQPGDEVKLMAIGGYELCKDLLERLETVNQQTERVELETTDRFNLLNRSDQYNFHVNQIPVIMFTDYGNGNYHLPTDDHHILQYTKLTRVTNLIYQLLINVGNGPTLCR